MQAELGQQKDCCCEWHCCVQVVEALQHCLCMLNRCKCRQVICSSKGRLQATKVGWQRGKCLLCRLTRCTCMQWGG